MTLRTLIIFFGGNSTSLIYAKKLNKIVVNCLSKNQIYKKIIYFD